MGGGAIVRIAGVSGKRVLFPRPGVARGGIFHLVGDTARPAAELAHLARVHGAPGLGSRPLTFVNRYLIDIQCALSN
jgi:hypothetical protein